VSRLTALDRRIVPVVARWLRRGQQVVVGHPVPTPDPRRLARSAAIGLTVPGFEAAWLADLGASAPRRYGPQPAPAGPLPPGWSGPALAAPPDAGSAAPASGAVPTTGSSTAGTAAPAAPNVGSSSGGGTPDGLILVAVVAAGLCVGGVLGYLRRRRIVGAAGIGAEGPAGPDPNDPGPPTALP